MSFLGGMRGYFEDRGLWDGFFLDEVLPLEWGGIFFKVLDYFEGIEGLILRIFVIIEGDP